LKPVWSPVKSAMIFLMTALILASASLSPLVQGSPDVYSRNFGVTVNESFFFGLFTTVKEKQISVNISGSDYDYWHHLRLEKTYHQWSTYVKVAQWAVQSGSGTQEIRSVVTQLQALSLSQEGFVNAVLQVDAQLTYNKRYPGIRHPIEVLVEETADCDGFSIFVASILKAAGYSVILIYYAGGGGVGAHMECGVHLDSSPTGEGSGWHYTYAGADYYICECAGQTSNWRTSWWHVGQCPREYQTQGGQLIAV